jgi:hypothetical protein
MRTMIKRDRTAVRRYNQPYSILPTIKKFVIDKKAVRSRTKPEKIDIVMVDFATMSMKAVPNADSDKT